MNLGWKFHAASLGVGAIGLAVVVGMFWTLGNTPHWLLGAIAYAFAAFATLVVAWLFGANFLMSSGLGARLVKGDDR